MAALGPQVAYLIPLPIHPETLGGFVQWRGFGFVPIITAFWPLMAATGAIRNEEERGLIEQWLAPRWAGCGWWALGAPLLHWLPAA